jgi:protein-disulfide isomerase
MRKPFVILAAAAALAGGYGIGFFVKRSLPERSQSGKYTPSKGSSSWAADPRRNEPLASPARYRVPLDNAPTMGGREPKVTIVVFSDFECPFSRRAAPAFKQVAATYGENVAVAFKHLPLSKHRRATPAALAAEAAREQGRFWEMHDRLFADRQKLERADFDEHARQIGLDIAKFTSSLASAELKERVNSDIRAEDKLGVRGTPAVLVNGRLLLKQPIFENLSALIDEEIVKSDELVRAGVSRKQLYSSLIAGGIERLPGPAAAERSLVASDLAGSPSRGPNDALVTIVEFADFECPFCARVQPAIEQVLERYGQKVRLVWQDFPLSFHQNAFQAALVARAAGEQGKFWQLHQKLLTNHKQLDRSSLERYASEVGLDTRRLKAALESGKFDSAVAASLSLGRQLGVGATPAFFINGIPMSGAQSPDAFRAVIDEQIKRAQALLAKGTPRSKLFQALLKDNATLAASRSRPRENERVHQIDPGGSPRRGPENAPITITVFADYECHYCAQVEEPLARLEKEFPDKIRMVRKNFPLEMHPSSRVAAEAVMAASDQGKFWMMHAKLLQNAGRFDRPSLEGYAQEIGLDLARFRESLNKSANAKRIDADIQDGRAVGVEGTPVTFINGRNIDGFQPYERYKELVEEELAKIEESEG